MVQQILRLFDASLPESALLNPALLEEFAEQPPEDYVPEDYVEDYYTEDSIESQDPADNLLAATQQLFDSDGSEAELVVLIHQAIDALHELCD